MILLNNRQIDAVMEFQNDLINWNILKKYDTKIALD
jgi:hypothetical protein